MAKERYRSSGLEVAVENVPGIGYATTAQQNLLQVGDVFLRGATVMKQRQDIESQQLGGEAGAEYAFKASKSVTVDDGMGGKQTIEIPDFMRMKGTDPYSIAFNRSQLAVYAARTETMIRERALDLGMKYRDNPAQMQAGMSRFLNAMSDTVPFELRAQVVGDGTKLMAPYLSAAYERMYKAYEADTKATFDTLQMAHANDAQRMGMLMAQGGAPAKDAAVNLAQMMRSFHDQVLLRTDGIRYTYGEAAKTAQGYMSTIAERITNGMFEGTKDKEALYTRLIRGELTVEVPMLVKNGDKLETTTQVVNLGSVMDVEAQNRLKSYMGSRIEAETSMRNQKRAEAKYYGELAANRDAKAAVMGDPDAINRLKNNPYASGSDLKAAQDALVEQPLTTDPVYYGTVVNQVLQGEVDDLTQVNLGRLAPKQRKEIADLINETADKRHWSKSVTFTNAVTATKQAITGTVSDMVAGAVMSKEMSTATQQEAAVKMIDRLTTETRKAVEGGMVIGDNTGGQVIAEFKGPKGETIRRFDPGAWAKAELARVDEKIQRSKKDVEALKKQKAALMDQWQQANQAGDKAKAKDLNDQMDALNRSITAAKAAQRAAIILEETP